MSTTDAWSTAQAADQMEETVTLATRGLRSSDDGSDTDELEATLLDPAPATRRGSIDSLSTTAEPGVVIDLRDGMEPSVYARPTVVERIIIEPPAGTDVDSGWVMLVGSSGGHLAQLVALQPWWTGRDRRWVTFRTPDAESLLADEKVTWAHFPTTRNARNLVRNALLSVRMMRRDRPEAIVTTGAGVALPFFVLGRLLGIPTVYIEVYDRIDSRTLTARLCRPFTSCMLVQWEEQRDLYPHATLVGTLL